MSKPSTKTSPQRPKRRKPAARKPVAKPAPAPVVEPPQPREPDVPAKPEPTGPADMFDANHDEAPAEPAAIVESGVQGEGVEKAGPEPDVDLEAARREEEELREFDKGEELIEEDEAAPAAAAEPEAPAAAEPTFDAPGRVQLGAIKGVLYRLPVGVVQQLLGPDALDRVAHLQTHPTIQELQARMRATDGHCAPVYFTENEDPNLAPSLFSGVESIAAALNLELPLVSVVTVAAGDAGLLQAWLAQQLAARNKRSATQADDDVLAFAAYDQ